MCACVCVCVYIFIKLHKPRNPALSSYNRHSMPLALILPRGNQCYLLEKPLMMIRRNKGEGVCVFVLLTKWCITAQSGPAILVTLYATRIIYY